MDVEKLSNEELYKVMKEQGLNVGPVTDTTRSLYVKKLLKHLGQSTSPDVNEAKEKAREEAKQERDNLNESRSKLEFKLLVDEPNDNQLHESPRLTQRTKVTNSSFSENITTSKINQNTVSKKGFVSTLFKFFELSLIGIVTFFLVYKLIDHFSNGSNVEGD